MGRITPLKFDFKNGHTVIVRNGNGSDARQIIDLTASVIEEGSFWITTPLEINPNLKEKREWIKSYLIHPGRLLIVAETRDELVGMLDFYNGSRRRIVHRGSFAMSVKREWRKLGIGTLLLSTLLDWAARNPIIYKVGLSVLADNLGAIELYRKMGFIEEGRRRCEIRMESGEFKDDVLMYKMVKPVDK